MDVAFVLTSLHHRCRKKIRHEELLRCEKELNELKQRIGCNLRDERTKALKQFISVRQEMINNNNDDDKDSKNENAQLLSSSFDNTGVGSIDSFDFRVEEKSVDGVDVGKIGVDAAFSSSSSSPSSPSPISIMKSWDQKMRSRVSFQNGRGREGTATTSFVSSFIYEIEDGMDGIAVSNNGKGFVQADLVLHKMTMTSFHSSNTTCTKQRIVLCTGILKVQFKSESNQLSSVTWTTLRDYFMPPSNAPRLESTTMAARDSSSSSTPKTGGSGTLSSSVVDSGGGDGEVVSDTNDSKNGIEETNIDSNDNEKKVAKGVRQPPSVIPFHE